MLSMDPDAADTIVTMVREAGAAPEGGLRIHALAGANPRSPGVTASVSATATPTDTVFVDDDTGARVFADQATADVVDGRTLVLEPGGGEQPAFGVK
ncbi:hypothetical protein OG738_03875 [Amycolatopsis sp. NBC_01488]|uniref:hypothetical protein n=1 Tax=Amycolatopsis sp. NBC_01488 TaxID=2903563 RepID=UPI002E28DE0F|nr:hypothetical protein [Amycolatopsis sp. NBC_01488]